MASAALATEINNDIAATLIFENVLSATECATLREAAAALPEANVSVYPAPRIVTRQATTRLIETAREHSWLLQRLLSFAGKANKYFRFDIHERVEPVMQVAYGPGDFFDWHTDLGDGPESTRKISLSVQLSAPEEYEGGLLHMVSCETPIQACGAGTLIAFPSHLAHRVTPVTRGTRHALVAWVHGTPFR
jgi:PKHD-type hydroxylase